jgi:hypothetical protein
VGFACSRCGHDVGHALRTRVVLQCGRCRNQTSLTASTLFHSTKLPLTQCFLALHLIIQTKPCMPRLKLSRHVGIQQITVWPVLHKVMLAMRIRERSRRKVPYLEKDIAYLGGRYPVNR